MNFFVKINKIKCLTLTFLLFLLISCPSSRIETKPQNNQTDKCAPIPKTRFAHRWWEYYERGLWFQKKGLACIFRDERKACFSHAEECYREAIRQRDDDRWNIRTYGMHSADYFPNRELGTLLYYSLKNEEVKDDKLLEESESYLKNSYKTAKSMKTAFYLDEVRKKIIGDNDNKPPVIVDIDTPDSSSRTTNAFSIKIEGKVEDDYFARQIFIIRENADGKEIERIDVPVDVSEKIISFEKNVTLNRGKNDFKFTAIDLAGNHSDSVGLTIYVDRVGPIIAVSDEFDFLPEEGNIQLIGHVFDKAGIKEIRVNDKKLPNNYSPEKTQLFFMKEMKYSAKKRPTFVIKATDTLGNYTIAEFKPKTKKQNNYLVMNHHSLVISDSEIYLPFLLSQNDEILKLTFLDEILQKGKIANTYNYKYLFQGYITTKFDNLKKIIVNGSETIIKLVNNTNERIPNKYYFSEYISLNKSINNLGVISYTEKMEANRFERVAKVNYIEPSIYKEKPKIIFGIYEGKSTDNEIEELRALYECFYNLRNELIRFELEKGGPKKFDDFYEPKYFMNFNPPYYIIAGKRGVVSEKTGRKHFVFNIANVEVSNFIDIYDEDIEILARQLNSKLEQELPKHLIGEIKSTKPIRQIFETDITKTKNIKKGMVVTAFKTEYPLDSGKLITKDFKRIGTANIEEVTDSYSIAKVREKQKAKKIKKGQYAITN